MEGLFVRRKLYVPKSVASKVEQMGWGRSWAIIGDHDELVLAWDASQNRLVFTGSGEGKFVRVRARRENHRLRWDIPEHQPNHTYRMFELSLDDALLHRMSWVFQTRMGSLLEFLLPDGRVERLPPCHSTVREGLKVWVREAHALQDGPFRTEVSIRTENGTTLARVEVPPMCHPIVHSGVDFAVYPRIYTLSGRPDSDPLFNLQTDVPYQERGYRVILRSLAPPDFRRVAVTIFDALVSMPNAVCYERARATVSKLARPISSFEVDIQDTTLLHLSISPDLQIERVALELVAQLSGVGISSPRHPVIDDREFQRYFRSVELSALPVILDSGHPRYRVLLTDSLIVDLAPATRGFERFSPGPILIGSAMWVAPGRIEYRKDSDKVSLESYRVSVRESVASVEYPIKTEGRIWVPVFGFEEGNPYHVRLGYLQIDWYGAEGLARVMNLLARAGDRYPSWDISSILWDAALSCIPSRLTLAQFVSLRRHVLQANKPISWLESVMPGWDKPYSWALDSTVDTFDRYHQVIRRLFGYD